MESGRFQEECKVPLSKALSLPLSVLGELGNESWTQHHGVQGVPVTVPC